MQHKTWSAFVQAVACCLWHQAIAWTSVDSSSMRSCVETRIFQDRLVNTVATDAHSITRSSAAIYWQNKMGLFLSSVGLYLSYLGAVSLTFCKLSKRFSWNLCIAETVLLMTISSWNFVHVQSLSLKFSSKHDFWHGIFWRAHETLVQQTLGHLGVPKMIQNTKTFLCLLKTIQPMNG